MKKLEMAGWIIVIIGAIVFMASVVDHIQQEVDATKIGMNFVERLMISLPIFVAIILLLVGVICVYFSTKNDKKQ